MALDFPTSPTVGTIHPTPAVAGVPQYQWDGSVWSAVGSGAIIANNVTSNATFPADNRLLRSDGVARSADTANISVDDGGNVNVPAGIYLNWGAGIGAAGYGFRDAGGSMEFRHNGGDWTTVGTGGAVSSQWVNGAAGAIYYNSGNVGIGASIPDQKLHVVGNAHITGNILVNGQANLLGNAAGSLLLPTAANTNVLLYNHAASSWSGIGSDTNGHMYFVTGVSGTPSARTIIHNDGKIALSNIGGVSYVMPGIAGVKGDGVANDFTAINNLVAASNTIIFHPGNYVIGSNLLISAGKAVWFHAGAVLIPSNTIYVMILGKVNAPPNVQIFNHGAGGTVLGPRQVHPEWWGAKNDGATIDNGYLNMADTSVRWGAENGAVGPSEMYLNSGLGYLVSNTVYLTPSTKNSLRVIGSGLGNCFITAATGGSFGDGVVAIRGETPGGGNQSMNFHLQDITIRAQSPGLIARGLVLALAGFEITSDGARSLIHNVKIQDFRTGIGWHNARQIDIEGGAIWLPRINVTQVLNNGVGQARLVTDSNMASHGIVNGSRVDVAGVREFFHLSGEWTVINVGVTSIDLDGSTYDPPAGGSSPPSPYNTVGSIAHHECRCIHVYGQVDKDWAGDCNIDGMDFVGGREGPVGEGIRFTSTLPRNVDVGGSLVGMNIAGWRIKAIGYTLRMFIEAEVANKSTMGDHWLLSGTQLDNFGGICNYQTDGSRTKAVANIRIEDIYITGPLYTPFRFAGGITDGVLDIHIAGARIRGLRKGQRLAVFEHVSALNFVDNQMMHVEGVTEVIYLWNVQWAVISNNNLLPDGIAGAVPYFVHALGGTKFLTVVGNNCAFSVSYVVQNASGMVGGTELRIGHNIPAVPGDI